MDTKSVPPPPTTRTTRGIKLHRDHAASIVRTAPHTYEVPSCTGGTIYEVDLRSESCTCPDRPPRGEVCKHTFAALIFRIKAGECVGCGVHRPRRELREAGEGHPMFCPDELLCRRCARRHGVL
jgi:hypothetical protein